MPCSTCIPTPVSSGCTAEPTLGGSIPLTPTMSLHDISMYRTHLPFFTSDFGMIHSTRRSLPLPPVKPDKVLLGFWKWTDLEVPCRLRQRSSLHPKSPTRLRCQPREGSRKRTQQLVILGEGFGNHHGELEPVVGLPLSVSRTLLRDQPTPSQQSAQLV